jgi:hypothetical protein
MANMLEKKPINSFLLVGPGGSGKTFQFRTLPGKKFAWVFDPNALASLAGQDIEYFDGVVDISGKGAPTKDVGALLKSGTDTAFDIYTRFWNDFRDKQVKGFFDDYQAFLFDGLTGWGAIVEDVVLRQLGKPTGEIEKREWSQYHKELSKPLRDIAALVAENGKSLLVTAHRRQKMDQAGEKLLSTDISVTGQSRNIVPIHFANIMFTTSEGDSKGVRYFAYTKRSEIIGDARMSDALSHLPMKIELTVADTTKPTDYGLGKLIKESNAKGANGIQTPA